MDTGTALMIVGGVCSLLGIVMNVRPIKFDEDLYGKLEGELNERETILRNFGAQLRCAIGALLIAIGIIAIYNRELPTDGAENLLVSMGIGFIILMGVIAAGFYRKFVDVIIVPPLIVFSILTGICFYVGLM